MHMDITLANHQQGSLSWCFILPRASIGRQYCNEERYLFRISCFSEQFLSPGDMSWMYQLAVL